MDAAGYESFYDAISNCHVALGRCRGFLKKARRNINSNWMALNCAIGEFVRPLTYVTPGQEATARYLPLDESILSETIFEVGYSLEFYSTQTGQLICFANDAQNMYWNNKGLLSVTVTRTSWPPKNDTYFQPLYLRSCDSASVVYEHSAKYYGNSSIPAIFPNGTNAVYEQWSKIIQLNGNDWEEERVGGLNRVGTVVDCNLNGGGSGWTPDDFYSTTTVYGSGMPDAFQPGGFRDW